MLDSGYRVEDNSDIENSVINAAKKHFNDGNYDLAIKLYQGLLNTSASSKLYMDVGLCYYKKNEFNLALEYLSKATVLDNKNSIAYSYIGNCYFRKLDANKAIENWTIARSISPKDESVCLNLAIAYFAKNMTYESAFYYDKFLNYAQNKETPQYKSIQKNINTLIAEAQDFYIQAQRDSMRHDTISAEKNYLTALKKDPINSEYNTAIGDLYYRLHQYADAIKHYEYAIRYNNNKNLILKIAQSYENMYDINRAYCFYARYHKFIISNQKAYLDMAKTINSLRKQIDEFSTHSILEMAKTEYKNNEYNKSLMDYENYVILNPDLKNEYISIINHLKSIINPEKTITRQYIQRGNELLNNGEIKGANRYFTEVMHLSNPKSEEYKLAKSKI